MEDANALRAQNSPTTLAVLVRSRTNGALSQSEREPVAGRLLRGVMHTCLEPQVCDRLKMEDGADGCADVRTLAWISFPDHVVSKPTHECADSDVFRQPTRACFGMCWMRQCDATQRPACATWPRRKSSRSRCLHDRTRPDNARRSGSKRPIATDCRNSA